MAKREPKPEPVVEPTPEPVVELPDVNPQLAFAAAWDKNLDNMRAVLTRTGQVRGNLPPSAIRRAEEIKAKYGV